MAYPVLISVYTRLKHLQNCIESLSENELARETDLFVVSDAAKFPQHKESVDRVREYIRSVKGFKSVNLFAWEKTKGSAESVRSARMLVFEKYDAQIFMEDDNIVSPLFLEFLNDSLNKYKSDPFVFGVCGFNFDIQKPDDYHYDAYFMDAISANGWGYWKDKYMHFFNNYTLPDFKGKAFKTFEKHYNKPANNLRRMAIQGAIWGDTKITHYMYERKMACLFPCVSLVEDTGWDGSGEHCNKKELSSNHKINTTVSIRLFPEYSKIDASWAKVLKKFFAYKPFGKYKTALYDLKVRMRVRMSVKNECQK